jgi:predicted metal-dependent enzyme (double-stranded beta helix superfamily)
MDASSMLVAVFAPGARAPIHDHGSWAVIGIYRGREQETWFRRVDDRSVAGRARLEVDRTRINPGGTVAGVPNGVIHTVEALDGQEAVSIHVYGTDIVTQARSTFDLEAGTESPFSPPFAGQEQHRRGP